MLAPLPTKFEHNPPPPCYSTYFQGMEEEERSLDQNSSLQYCSEEQHSADFKYNGQTLVSNFIIFASYKPKSKYIHVLRITEFKNATFVELNVSLLRCKCEEALIQLAPLHRASVNH